MSVLRSAFGKGEREEQEKMNQHHFDLLIYCFSHASVLTALKAILPVWDLLGGNRVWSGSVRFAMLRSRKERY